MVNFFVLSSGRYLPGELKFVYFQIYVRHMHGERAKEGEEKGVGERETERERKGESTD